MRRFNALWFICLSALTAFGQGNDWPHWRGPNHTGYVDATGLIDQWTQGAENALWRSELTSRSTPVVFNGKVYVFGRVGDKVNMQEVVYAHNAENGKKLWDYRINVYDTAVPHKRAAWSSPAVDVETGHVYVATAGALAICLNEAGDVVWQRNLTEEFGAFTGYGGRTITPLVIGEVVIIGYVTSAWGPHGLPAQRFYAFNKKTGETHWVSAPGGRFGTPNIYSSPVVAMIDDVPQLISGNADGSVYGINAYTGVPIWSFKLSKRGMNASVTVVDNVVYAAHGEENLDEPFMGRVVAIDATGTGDVTETHEVWRADKLEVGYVTPAVHDGKVYVIENSANLHCLDAKTGKELWQHSLGTVGKGSPVIADGKMYISETNGKFYILKLKDDGVEVLDDDFISYKGERYAELYGSAAIAYNRIYFTTEEALYCIGDPKTPYKVENTPYQAPPTSDGKPVLVQVIPGDVSLLAGQTQAFKARLYDAKGALVKETNAEWALKGLKGKIESSGNFVPADVTQVGLVAASVDGLRGTARVRTFQSLPWREDFEAVAVDGKPSHWIRAGNPKGPASKFIVTEFEGNKVLLKPRSKVGVQRTTTYFGSPEMSGYVIQADVYGVSRKRFRPDMGLHSHGYKFDMRGMSRRVKLYSWLSEERMSKEMSFDWEPDSWYTMKMQVDYADGKAIVKGKVWKRGEEEPAEWTITAEDPHPITKGSPGIYGYSTNSDIYYDNIEVTEK